MIGTQYELEADRLARVRLGCTIEPGDLHVTGLVSEVGAGKVLDYIGAAADGESHWAFSIGQELTHVDPSRVLDQRRRPLHPIPGPQRRRVARAARCAPRRRRITPDLTGSSQSGV
ncbi:hypothetical protein CFI00_06770 [Nocardioides sp. S5]|uniref:hypothetical protein n=1 Tax=Nocardioides sp. S5 TaxID=2017486 RepID=UPI001A8C183F|nr:hypothetical protein [Nocardioides sp. S5]QSR30223.1 hypothetical protein CFI00_06770 [Nocardioides sp. S5]